MERSVQNVRGFNQLLNWHLVSGLKLNVPISKGLTMSFESC